MITSSVINYSSCDSNNDNTGQIKYLIANGVAESLDLPYNVLFFGDGADLQQNLCHCLTKINSRYKNGQNMQ